MAERVAEPVADKPHAPGYGFETAKSPPGERLPWARAVEWLQAARNYWVVTTRPDGRPHAAPVWGLWLDGAVLFSTGPGSRKGRNLAANRAVVVHLESGDDAVILEGTAEPVTDPGRLARFADAYKAKYRFRPDPDDPNTPVWALRPRVAFTWGEADFPESATRWRFADGGQDELAAR
jgi:PPOX class probable F420-dependent enzyme